MFMKRSLRQAMIKAIIESTTIENMNLEKLSDLDILILK